MSTSANVTDYVVQSIDGKSKHTNSQHCMCKNTISDWLKTFTPSENYLVQLCHDDENGVANYSKRVNLKAYLERKYRFTIWREEDGDVDDSHYCMEHGHQDLKENCVYCLKEKLAEAEAYIKQMDSEHFKSDLKSGVCPFAVCLASWKTFRASSMFLCLVTSDAIRKRVSWSSKFQAHE